MIAVSRGHSAVLADPRSIFIIDGWDGEAKGNSATHPRLKFSMGMRLGR